MSAFHDVILAGASGSQGYKISRSVRLRSSASAYFNRTLTTPTDGKKWTYSVWLKRGSTIGLTSGADNLLATASGSVVDEVRIIHDNGASGVNDSFQYSASGFTVKTLAVRRDPSAWCHMVVAVDTTQATAANRVRLYFNGAEMAYDTSTYPSLNATTSINSSTLHNIGARTTGGLYFDGYLTEINFIDGQALTPSSFGETDTITGVWKPKRYTGTYGTNGFYLNFSDPSAATAAAIGKDYSGNGNNWTPNNISVAAGSTYDSMLDVPTPYADGGNGRGNYAVLNPLGKFSTGGVTVSDGNLSSVLDRSTYNNWVPATIELPSTGKFYFEVQQTAQTGGTGPNLGVGLINSSTPINQQTPTNYRSVRLSNGDKSSEAGAVSYGSSFALNDICQIAIDVDSGKIWFGKNGTWFASGDPVAGTNAAYTDIVSAGYKWFPAISNFYGNTTNTANANFGQRPFAYTPPTGFKALNTQNLPEPTIKKGNQYFDVVTRNGFGSSGGSITSLQFQPDFMWEKQRNGVSNHYLVDAVRGVSKYLNSDATAAEGTLATYVTSFNSNGYTMGSSDFATTATMVDYVWKESASAGFDIVTWTGTGVNRTIAHSLGVAPKMIIAKHKDAVDNWIVYHASLGGSPDYLWLNLTSAKGVSSTVWNTAPTSSVFGVGTDNLTNLNGGSYVAYLFAEVAGFSKFGSYTGNGSADGPFVYLGFRPRFIMFKRTDTTSNWVIKDTARSAYNVGLETLYPNLSNAEAAGESWDATANGIKLRSTSTEFNASGGTYIYAAFSEVGFKYALGR